MLSFVFIPCTVSGNHEHFNNLPSVSGADANDANAAHTEDLCIMMSQHSYSEPSAMETAWKLYYALLQLYNVPDLMDVLEGDPAGAVAVLDVLDPSCNQDFPTVPLPSIERGQNAMHFLLGSGYNKLEGRATTSFWMMKVSLLSGHFDFWGPCLDLVLHWMRVRFCEPIVDISSLNTTEQAVLKDGIWSDIIAGATTGRIPSQIEWYRKALNSSHPPILDCHNKDALVFAEAVALASLPDHISRSGTSVAVARLRRDIDASTEDHIPRDAESTIKAKIHKAGVALYLETVAHHGVACSPSVQAAVRSLCELVRGNLQRDFAFWIFLAGCHALDADRWSDCRTMFDLLLTGPSDQALTAASGKSNHTSYGSTTTLANNGISDIMNNVHNAREQGFTQSYCWKRQMQERGILLV